MNLVLDFKLTQDGKGIGLNDYQKKKEG